MGTGSGSSGPGGAEGGRILAFPTREKAGLSRRAVVWELEETQLDLAAFQRAYSAVHQRVTEVRDEGRIMKLVEWSGTSAVMGSLDLTIHAMERTAEELKEILLKIDEGEIPNLDEA